MFWFDALLVLVQFLAVTAWLVLFLQWRRQAPHLKRMAIVTVGINFLMGILLLGRPWLLPDENPAVAQGEWWTIEQVIAAEPDARLRAWKKQLVGELSTNLNRHRQQQGWEDLELPTTQSFSAIKLYQLLLTDPTAVQLVDAREAYEVSEFMLPGSQHHRYGDLANRVDPNLDKNRLTIVLCYSGIRGYLGANLLREMGHENVAFVRGGLGAWLKRELPVQGDDDSFLFLSQKYNSVPVGQVSASAAPKVDFRAEVPPNERFSNLHRFYGELAPTTELQAMLQTMKDEAVILLCHEESECFDAVNFSYDLERSGGTVLGYARL